MARALVKLFTCCEPRDTALLFTKGIAWLGWSSEEAPVMAEGRKFEELARGPEVWVET